MTEEELLLEQLKNMSVDNTNTKTDIQDEHDIMKEALHQYENDILRTNGILSSSEPSTKRATDFNVPVVPSPLTSRRFVGEDGEGDDGGGYLMVDDGKKSIKLSSDSGLGSVELVEESNSWRNGESYDFI